MKIIVSYLVLQIAGCPSECLQLNSNSKFYAGDFCVENLSDKPGYVKIARPTLDAKVVMMTPGLEPCSVPGGVLGN